MAPPRPIPPVRTELDSKLAEAADAEYDATWQAELCAAEKEPAEGFSLQESWERLCAKHPWLSG